MIPRPVFRVDRVLRFLPTVLAGAMSVGICLRAESENPEKGTEVFNRITPGWTNYSTAFNATHDSGSASDYATVAALYTPASTESPLSFEVIVIGSETKPPDFQKFGYIVLLWSSLPAFIQEPRRGDVATFNFSEPTGGNTSAPDTLTRGGRGAYRLQFSLTNSSVALTQAHEYVIGFAAQADTRTAGELFVPTSSHAGPSDLQAGDLVPGGWRYLVDAGGSTIYSGQLAMAFAVSPAVIRPRLEISHAGTSVELRWPATFLDFRLESAVDLFPTTHWRAVEIEPFEENGVWRVILPVAFQQQWFRLRH